MIDMKMVLAAAECPEKPTGHVDLDAFYKAYNEGSPRHDDALYYRFLYRLAPWICGFLELGCKYGVASLHVLRGNPAGFAWACDTSVMVKPTVMSHKGFEFFHGRSTDQKFIDGMADEVFDAILIDTDHTYDTTKAEFELWQPKLRHGGVVLFDDIDAPEYADGCGKFFRELTGEKVSLPHLHPDNWGFGCWFKGLK